LLVFRELGRHVNHHSATVSATIQAHAMTQMGFATFRAFGKARRGEGVMRAPIGGMRPRMSHSYNHDYILTPFSFASKF